MQYTPDEISNIHLLAEHPDLNNVLLAFELIKSRGIVSELVNDIYWIYNRLIWAEEHRMAKQVAALFQTYWVLFSSITDIPPKSLLYLDSQIETKVVILNLDLTLLSQRLFQYSPNPTKDFIIRFLFKHGTRELQIKILPLLKTREHTGRFLLNLGKHCRKQLTNTSTKFFKFTKITTFIRSKQSL